MITLINGATKTTRTTLEDGTYLSDDHRTCFVVASGRRAEFDRMFYYGNCSCPADHFEAIELLRHLPDQMELFA